MSLNPQDSYLSSKNIVYSPIVRMIEPEAPSSCHRISAIPMPSKQHRPDRDFSHSIIIQYIRSCVLTTQKVQYGAAGAFHEQLLLRADLDHREAVPGWKVSSELAVEQRSKAVTDWQAGILGANPAAFQREAANPAAKPSFFKPVAVVLKCSTQGADGVADLTRIAARLEQTIRQDNLNVRRAVHASSIRKRETEEDAVGVIKSRWENAVAVSRDLVPILSARSLGKENWPARRAVRYAGVWDSEAR